MLGIANVSFSLNSIKKKKKIIVLALRTHTHSGNAAIPEVSHADNPFGSPPGIYETLPNQIRFRKSGTRCQVPQRIKKG